MQDRVTGNILVLGKVIGGSLEGGFEEFQDRPVQEDASGDHGRGFCEAGDRVLHGAGGAGHFAVLFGLFRAEEAEQDNGVGEDDWYQDTEIVEVAEFFSQAQVIKLFCGKI